MHCGSVDFGADYLKKTPADEENESGFKDIQGRYRAARSTEKHTELAI
jgi:hypothetical protein